MGLRGRTESSSITRVVVDQISGSTAPCNSDSVGVMLHWTKLPGHLGISASALCACVFCSRSERVHRVARGAYRMSLRTETRPRDRQARRSDPRRAENQTLDGLFEGMKSSLSLFPTCSRGKRQLPSAQSLSLESPGSCPVAALHGLRPDSLRPTRARDGDREYAARHSPDRQWTRV